MPETKKYPDSVIPDPELENRGGDVGEIKIVEGYGGKSGEETVVEEKKSEQLPEEIILYYLLPKDVRFYLKKETKAAIDKYIEKNQSEAIKAEKDAQDFYSNPDHKTEMAKIGYGEMMRKIEELTKERNLKENTFKEKESSRDDQSKREETLKALKKLTGKE